MKKWLSWAFVGATVAVLAGSAVRATVRPPDTWLWVFVRSNCGPSEQALSDARSAPFDTEIAVLPLDRGTAPAACALTFSRLTRLRPWLGWLPERWICDVLRSHAIAEYERLQIEDEAAPVYRLGEHISLGWSPQRGTATRRGDTEAIESD